MSEDLQLKLQAARGLISGAEHRINRAWKASYSDLVDASNLLCFIETEVKNIKKSKSKESGGE